MVESYQIDPRQRIIALGQPIYDNHDFSSISSYNNLIVNHVEPFTLDRQQQQQQQQRSLSNQSRASVYSVDSRSTTASISYFESTKPTKRPIPRSKTNCRNHHRVIHGNKNNNQPSMNMSEIKPLYSTSNSLYTFNGEPSKQRFGIDPNRTNSSSSIMTNPNNSNRCSNLNRQPPPTYNNVMNNCNQVCAPMLPAFVHQQIPNQQIPNLPPLGPPCNQDHLSNEPKSPSPCSTCTSSTTPQMEDRPSQMQGASTKPCDFIMFNQRLPSGPPPLTTSVETYQQNRGINAGTCSSSAPIIHASSSSNMMCNSQTRPRRDSWNVQNTTRRYPEQKQQCVNAGWSNSSVLSEGQPNNNVCSDARQGQPIPADVPIITPVKTGKKVQYRKTKVCPWNQHGRCVMGDSCNYAHTKTELRGRPDLTRTRLCPDVESCKRTNCRFAHDVSQLRATGAFFRTKLCKFWMRGTCPAGNHCRHAHGEIRLRHPETIAGPDEHHESPREAIFLSGLCNDGCRSHRCNHHEGVGVNCGSHEKQSTTTCSQRLSYNDTDDDITKYDGTFDHYNNQEHQQDEEQEVMVITCHGDDLQQRFETTTSESLMFHDSTAHSTVAEIDDQRSLTQKCSKAESAIPIDGSNEPENVQQRVVHETVSTHHQSPINQPANLLARLSDDELSAAVSDYLFLSHGNGTNQQSPHPVMNFSTTQAQSDGFNCSLLGPPAITTTDGQDEEINRLVKALTSATSVNHDSSNSSMANIETSYDDHIKRTPPPPTTRYMHARTSTTLRRKNNIERSMMRTDITATPNSSSFHHNNHHLSGPLSGNLASSSSGVNAQSLGSLMFPSPGVSVSPGDLKLNDILNIAVASQDPDLLECSAKIIRASIQYRQKQQEQLAQQQQQSQARRFLTPQPSSSVVRPSTSSAAVSSFPSSPRLTTPRYNQNLFNPYGSNNQTFYL